MKKVSRFFSLMVCLAVLCSLLCTTAFASDDSVDYDNWSFTGMEGLKTLISDYDGEDADHAQQFRSTEHELIITESISIPGDLRIHSGRIVIPKGVTVTLEPSVVPDGGRMDAGNLVVEGTLVNNGTVFLWDKSEVYGEVINHGLISVADYKDGQDGYLSFYDGDYSGTGAIFMTADSFENTYFRISGLNEYDFAYDLIESDGMEKTYIRVLFDYFNSDVEPDPSDSVPMFRMYDSNSGEHFYSGSTLERHFLQNAGWFYEGVGFNFPAEGAPVYRLYEPVHGEHLYTMGVEEKDALLSQGWEEEGVAFNSAGSSGVPQYRLHNPNVNRGGYHFTGSEEERNLLISYGWIPQGIGWFSCEE